MVAQLCLIPDRLRHFTHFAVELLEGHAVVGDAARVDVPESRVIEMREIAYPARSVPSELRGKPVLDERSITKEHEPAELIPIAALFQDFRTAQGHTPRRLPVQAVAACAGQAVELINDSVRILQRAKVQSQLGYR